MDKPDKCPECGCKVLVALDPESPQPDVGCWGQGRGWQCTECEWHEVESWKDHLAEREDRKESAARDED